MGIKDLCITSDGKKYENPKTIKKYEKKLTKLQRQLAGKTKGSGKYQKVGCEVSEAGSPQALDYGQFTELIKLTEGLITKYIYINMKP